ncbi:uncharacterized protein N7459_003324 [Penicillium hispanicum]|uniref:uncharacterized protein n=1 Tax=Penicillium hispanicum TaxID=1080232 RepID=UPI0025401FFC|nr:uncharacterized protein N7459_003324 [Penicillium hispanicum]KAJ5587559.1 hypothetical protein N7459_003324 [Penicillium hispanicum]
MTAPLRTSVPAPSAIDNLAKLPGGLWAMIFLVVCSVGCIGVFFFKKKSGDKPQEAEEIPADDLFGGVASPQTALTAEWLRERRAGQPSRPLPILVESAGPEMAPPAADSLTSGVVFVAAPPGYTLPPGSALPPSPRAARPVPAPAPPPSPPPPYAIAAMASRSSDCDPPAA